MILWAGGMEWVGGQTDFFGNDLNDDSFLT